MILFVYMLQKFVFGELQNLRDAKIDGLPYRLETVLIDVIARSHKLFV